MNHEYGIQLICTNTMECGRAALLLNSLFQGQSEVLMVEEGKQQLWWGKVRRVSSLKVDGRAEGAIRTVFIDFKATAEVDEVVWEALVVSRVGLTAWW